MVILPGGFVLAATGYVGVDFGDSYANTQYCDSGTTNNGQIVWWNEGNSAYLYDYIESATTYTVVDTEVIANNSPGQADYYRTGSVSIVGTYTDNAGTPPGGDISSNDLCAETPGNSTGTPLTTNGSSFTYFAGFIVFFIGFFIMRNL